MLFLILFIILSVLYSATFFKLIEIESALKINYFIFILYLISFTLLLDYMEIKIVYLLNSIFTFVFIFATLCGFYTLNATKKFFFATGFCFIHAVSYSVCIALYASIQNIPVSTFLNSSPRLLYNLACTYGLSLLLLLLFAYFFHKKNIMKALDDSSLKSITLILVFLTILINIVTIIYYIDFIFEVLPIFTIIISTVFFVSSIAVITYYSNMDIVDKTIYKNKILEKQLILQMNHYKKNIEYIIALRKIKHDYFNLLNSLEYLSENYEKEDLLKYVTELHQNAAKIDHEFNQYSSNPLIDAVIMDAKNICDYANIKLESIINFPDTLAITEDEICFVFASILNKSIAVSDDCITLDRHINVTCNIKSNWVVLSSTCNCEDTKANSLRLNDNKKNKHSDDHQLYIVEEIAKKYNGFLEITKDKENHFYQIQLFLPKNKPLM